jgi:phospholipase C
MPSPSAPSQNADKTYAGKTTLPEADLQAEYFTHGAPAAAVASPPPMAVSTVPGRAFRCM